MNSDDNSSPGGDNLTPQSSSTSSTPQSAERSDLSHFRKVQQKNQDHHLPPKKRRAISHHLSPAEILHNFANFKGRFKHTFRHVKLKYFVIIFLVVVVLPAVVIIAQNIPMQFARSSAFGLFVEGQYQESLDKFNIYLEKRPNDSDAVMHAALAALRLQKFDEARQHIKTIANTPAAEQPGYLFPKALLDVPLEDRGFVIGTLNKLIAVAPEHAAGRLLRGILLGTEGDVRRAREDFLQADASIRSAKNFDDSELFSVHQMIYQNSQTILPEFNPPLLDDETQSNYQQLLLPLSHRLNTAAVFDLYANTYFPALPETMSAIDAEGLIGIYYTVMLLQAGQLNEADVEFSKLSEILDDGSPISILTGIRQLMAGNYAQAAEIFESLEDSLGETYPIIYLNRANALMFAEPSKDNFPRLISLLKRAAESPQVPAVTHHNLAFLSLLSGDYDEAREHASALSDAQDLPQTPLLRAVIALADDPASEEASQLLDAVPDKKTPVYVYATIIRDAAGPDRDKLVPTLAKLIETPVSGPSYLVPYAEQLAKRRLMMRALRAMNIAKRNSPEDQQLRFNIIRLAVNSGDLARAEDEYWQLNPESPYHNAARGQILAAQSDPSGAIDAINLAIQNASPLVKRQIATASADVLFDSGNENILSQLLIGSSMLSPIESVIVARLQASHSPETVLELVNNAVAYDPSFDVMRHAGIALADAGHHQEAMDLLTKAVNLNPTHVRLLESLYKVQSEHKTPDAAITRQSIDNILHMRENPDDPENAEPPYSVINPANERLASHIYRAVHGEAPAAPALKDFDALISNVEGATQAQLILQRGSFLMGMKNFPAASETLYGALEVSGIDDEAHTELRRTIANYLAKSLVLQKEYLKAAEVYLKIAKWHPQLSLYRRLAGRSLARGGDLEKAEEVLMETIELFPTDIETYFLLADEVYKRTNNEEAMILVLRRAARAMPLYAPIYQSLSRAQATSNVQAAKENSAILSFLTPGA